MAKVASSLDAETSLTTMDCSCSDTKDFLDFCEEFDFFNFAGRTVPKAPRPIGSTPISISEID